MARTWTGRAGRAFAAALAIAALAATLLAACGDDEREPVATPVAAAETASSASRALDAFVARAQLEYEDAGPGAVFAMPEGATEVRVSLAEWTVEPSVSAVEAGTIYFLVDNLGPEDPHDFVVIRSDLPVDQLPAEEERGFVIEDAVDVIGAIKPFTPASSASAVFTLTPGRYVLICNIVEWEDEGGGRWEAHYAEGMRAEFLVE